jgi:hypothetical protein
MIDMACISELSDNYVLLDNREHFIHTFIDLLRINIIAMKVLNVELGDVGQ